MMSYLKKHHLVLTLLLTAFVLVPQTTQAQLSTIAGFAFDLTGGLLSPIAVGIVKLVSYITMLSGVVLNASVYYTVVNMADSLSTNNLPALKVAWTTVRDLANMGFIFMLLYASIMTIVGKEKDARGIVVKMVIAAILINFSLFFTKVIIDVANLLALTFYSAIAPGAVGPDAFLSAGLSNNIIQALGAQTLWQSAGELDGSTVFIAAIMSSITLLVTAFVFAAMAVMFLVRYVVLIFVLILSPLMVLSSVFPALKDYSKKWWDALLNQAFFAPVFFILMWVTLTLITGISQSIFSSTSSLAGGLNASNFNADGVSVLINYAVILGFVVATLVISKSIADKASPIAANLNKWALGAAGGAGFGLAGLAGRRTLGAGGAAIADSERLKRAEEEGGFKGAAARLALAAGRKTSKSSFDVRASDTYGKISDTTGVGFGKAGGKGGFEQIVKDDAKKKKEVADSLKPSDIVVDEAKMKLKEAEDALKGDENNPEKIRAKENAQNRLDALQGVSEDEIKKRQKTAREENDKERDSRMANSPEIQEEERLIKEIEAKEKEIGETEDAGQRIALNDQITALKALKEDATKKASVIREEINKNHSDREETIAKMKKVKSVGDTRKERYAERLVDPRILKGWANPILFTSRGNKQAAAEIRKGKKKVEDLVKDALKASGEVKDEKEAGGSEDNAPKPSKPTP